MVLNTLRAESFAGRKFREIKKSQNFANLSFANSSFRKYFTKTMRKDFIKSLLVPLKDTEGYRDLVWRIAGKLIWREFNKLVV